MLIVLFAKMFIVSKGEIISFNKEEYTQTAVQSGVANSNVVTNTLDGINYMIRFPCDGGAHHIDHRQGF